VVNGQIQSFSDDLITNTTSNIRKKIVLANLATLNKTTLHYKDIVQIGVQSWVRDRDGEVILNSLLPTCSQPIYLKHPLQYVDNYYLKVANKFKNIIFSAPGISK
jgi:hypothetical protein